MKATLKVHFLILLALAAGSCTKGIGTDKDPGKEDPNASFVKNVLIMEFVSFDCVYCPNVSNILQDLSDKTYPGRIDVISVHGRLNEDDPMEFTGYRPFQNYFYGVTGYPGVIIDQRDDLVSVGSFDASGSAFQERINAVTPVGISLSSTAVNDNTVRVDIQVANKGNSSEDYRLAAVVLEGDIPYRQADLVNGSQQWIPNYRHHHVLRAFLSQNYFGDPIGTLAKNGRYSRSFTYTIPSGYKKENLSFVAYLIDAKGFTPRVSLNSRSAAIGKAADFQEAVRK